MAGVNISTGKIVGCEKDSLTWWHEKGHLLYNDSQLGIRNDIIIHNSMLVTMMFIIVSLFVSYKIFTFLAALSFLVMLLLLSYEEIWCWHYAYGKKKKE